MCVCACVTVKNGGVAQSHLQWREQARASAVRAKVS